MTLNVNEAIDARPGQAALELTGVTKRYSKLVDNAMLLRSILPFTRSQRDELLALHDINFRVEPGETIGILGRNGAGKSTLMRMLAGVSSPSEGLIRISGRVAPLLSVGVGFHAEMSGRENIYVNGMLLGLSKSEIDERFDAIVEFSEIGTFIDTPVKFYSSGMYMRLGFSVAVHVEPQILLLDEVLAVGDIAFQLKCFDRMRELQNRGTTIVMVSHSMHAIRLMCPRVLLFRRGQLEFDGDAESAISRHHQLLTLDGAEDHFGHTQMPVTILERTLRRDGVETAAADNDDTLEVTWTIRFEQDVKSPQATFRILSEDGTLAYSMHTIIGDAWKDFAKGDETEVRVSFMPRFGGGGTFRLLLDVTDITGVHVLGADLNGPRVYVGPRPGTGGLGDAMASISMADLPMTDHRSLAFGGPKAALAAPPEARNSDS
ncbi:MAG TPA: ABC transporter ATP-binding protein [Acidimicrobiales bacterium]|jgi:ABC-type polysaccharide/polyol phosphate transport system ATPase subunit|nr:ABC transporter ATP-binding protein [Acidimicrobiales bacterium]